MANTQNQEELANATPETLDNEKRVKEWLIAPESDAQARHWSIVESIGRRIGELQTSLKNSNPGVEATKALNQLRSLTHERTRLQRPAVLKSPALTKNEELRKAAKELFGEKFEQDEQRFLDNIAPKDLIKLESIQRGVIAKFYAFKEVKDDKGEAIEEPIDIRNLKEGDNIRIDFGKNARANAKIGAGDVLGTNVNVVKVIDTNGNIRIGRREIIGGHVGYYDVNGRYLPIFNGYRIRIPTQSEISGEEYKRLGVTKVFETDAERLAKLEKTEKAALVNFHEKLQANEKNDKVSEKVRELKDEVGKDGTYQERIKRAIELGEKKLKEMGTPEKEEDKETKELLTIAVERLKNTLKIFEGKDIRGLDIDRYKDVIAAHESGGMSYFARNDDWGKRHNINPEKWAFGKYQFTTETLRGHGVELGRPPEESKIQAFLADPALQERIMDEFVSNLLEKHILTNSSVMEEVANGRSSIVYYLALAHNGGPGAIKNGGTSNDYMSGKSADSYARAIADRYETGQDAGFLARLGRKPRVEAWADYTDRETFINNAYKHIGKEYVWGGGRKADDQGIDCSGLVLNALKDAGVVSSTYNNNAQGFFDSTVPKKAGDVQRGDLVFLQSGGRITHVEIALGPVVDGKIPILDAAGKSTGIGKVTERMQTINSRVIVGSPLFYRA